MKDSQVELFKLQAKICKTLSDYKRLIIIHFLRDGERSVGQLVTEMGLSQANVSQHLAILREQGIVAARRKGTSIYYSLSSPMIGQACDLVQSVLREQLTKTQVLAKSIRPVNDKHK